MSRASLPAGKFDLTAYARVLTPGQPLNVYIEGDGLSFSATGEVSMDPTPRTPLALMLAARDTAPNVLYLARPCQYVDLRNSRGCAPAYWSDRRFSEEVIAGISQAIDIFQAARLPGSEVNLIGFSGGAAVATLVAARRGDVTSLRTVAGNLDHEIVNAHHRVSRQVGSLNAVDVAPQIIAIPQLHFVGGRDSVIPEAVITSYKARSSGAPCVTTRRIATAGHSDGWVDIWPELLRMPLGC